MKIILRVPAPSDRLLGREYDRRLYAPFHGDLYRRNEFVYLCADVHNHRFRYGMLPICRSLAK